MRDPKTRHDGKHGRKVRTRGRQRHACGDGSVEAQNLTSHPQDAACHQPPRSLLNVSQFAILFPAVDRSGMTDNLFYLAFSDRICRGRSSQQIAHLCTTGEILRSNTIMEGPRGGGS